MIFNLSTVSIMCLLAQASFMTSNAEKQQGGLRGSIQQRQEERKLGCEINSFQINFNNYLPTTLSAVSSSLIQGGIEVPGCNNGAQSNYAGCWTVQPVDGTTPGTNHINPNKGNDKSSGCDGAHGTFTYKPDESFTEQTGLSQVVVSYKDNGGPNGETSFSQQFEYTNGVPNEGYNFGNSGANTTECGNPKDCTVTFDVKFTEAPTTVTYSNYTGQWVEVGSDGSISTSISVSSTLTQSTTQSTSFSDGFTEEASASFLGIGGKFDATQTMTSSVSNTITSSQTESATKTCGSIECTGTLYQWKVSATGSDGSTEHVMGCNFMCIDGDVENPKPPQCPLGYCLNDCQCCNNPWMVDSDGNLLPADTAGNMLTPSEGGSCSWSTYSN